MNKKDLQPRTFTKGRTIEIAVLKAVTMFSQDFTHFDIERTIREAQDTAKVPLTEFSVRTALNRMAKQGRVILVRKAYTGRPAAGTAKGEWSAIYRQTTNTTTKR